MLTQKYTETSGQGQYKTHHTINRDFTDLFMDLPEGNKEHDKGVHYIGRTSFVAVELPTFLQAGFGGGHRGHLCVLSQDISGLLGSCRALPVSATTVSPSAPAGALGINPSKPWTCWPPHAGLTRAAWWQWRAGNTASHANPLPSGARTLITGPALPKPGLALARKAPQGPARPCSRAWRPPLPRHGCSLPVEGEHRPLRFWRAGWCTVPHPTHHPTPLGNNICLS